MTNKLQPHQLEKKAYIYLRQSTIQQIRNNQESTERQYNLKNKALELGWSEEQIIILDNDLGKSGAQSQQREGFKKLVAEVCMEKTGAIFALEASRLSRSCADWHRLIGLCALTNTLIIDDDGIYDPSDFNDQLLLGLKGTMSQAELHIMHGRLQKAKLNKAQKGELHFPLPVGFCYDDFGNITPDIDAEVRGAVRLLFSTFHRVGTAHGVARDFAKNNLKFPKRAYGGVWRGKLLWGELTTSRVLQVLKNPSYAGAYVFGRHKYRKHISPEGEFRKKMKKLPMKEWPVHLQQHHEGYINWEEFQQNQMMLEKNRTNGEDTLLNAALREGCALLQGLLICGNCGHRISIRYKGHGGLYPMYECNKRRRDGHATSYCMSFGADLADQAITEKILEILTKDQIAIASGALNELVKRDKGIDNQWKMKIERAEYEAQLAQRRYEEVDPSNRLVVGTLEKKWNHALLHVEQVKQQYTEQQHQQILKMTSEEEKQILALAKDVPRLWHAPTTQAKDRKRILHLLIKDITVEKKEKRLILHLRWQGEAIEDIELQLPPRQCDKMRYPDDFVSTIRELALKLTDREIVEKLNGEGKRNAHGKPFTLPTIEWIRYKHRIPSFRKSNEQNDFTVEEVAKKFNISRGVVYYWISRKIVDCRKICPGSPWLIKLTCEKEKELVKRVAGSYKLK